jgi:hypothetical protein
VASPEPSRVQSPQTDVKRVKKENKSVKHEAADKKSRVKREASDVIDLTQDNRRGKRVKLENFIQGEIIDLT